MNDLFTTGELLMVIIGCALAPQYMAAIALIMIAKVLVDGKAKKK